MYFNKDRSVSSDEPEATVCPACGDVEVYKADSDHYFELIDASNYTSIPTSAQAYKKHLANNATFSYDGKRWNDATSSDVIAYGSAITQTASSVSAKVNKTNTSGETTEFGWQLLEKTDDAQSESFSKTGDADGQFTVYSKLTKASGERVAKDVLHINKNGL